MDENEDRHENISPRDYAVFSQQSYAEGGGTPPEGWEVLATHQTDEGFQAVAYVNHETQEVVVAYTGTNGLTDLDDDIQLALGNTPDQFSDARDFYHHTLEQLAACATDPDAYGLSFTGHSLGGHLATLMEQEAGHPAVVFDAPGTGSSDHHDHDDHPHEPDVTNYVSVPNVVNEVQPHEGEVVRSVAPDDDLQARYDTLLDPPEYSLPPSIDGAPEQMDFINRFIDYTLDSHSMDAMVERFDPDTGELREAPSYDTDALRHDWDGEHQDDVSHPPAPQEFGDYTPIPDPLDDTPHYTPLPEHPEELPDLSALDQFLDDHGNDIDDWADDNDWDDHDDHGHGGPDYGGGWPADDNDPPSLGDGGAGADWGPDDHDYGHDYGHDDPGYDHGDVGYDHHFIDDTPYDALAFATVTAVTGGALALAREYPALTPAPRFSLH